MKKTTTKGYYDVAELIRAIKEIQEVITDKRDHTFPINARNLEINIDQTTGNFAIRDMRRKDIDESVLYSMFPALTADVDLTQMPLSEEPPVAG